MSVYLERIDLQNYRSCKKATFELNENLSALIGANGAGKSNILNGILLLKKNTRVSRVRPDDEPFLSSCKLSARFNVDGVTSKYEALIEYATNERNIDEVVTATEKWNFKEITGQGKWLRLPLSIAHDLHRYRSHYMRAIRNVRGMMRVVSYSPIDELKLPKGVSETVSNVVRKVSDFVDGISYYSASRFTDPSKCPSSFELESERLSRRIPRMGDEHLQFMYDLYSAYKNNKSEFDEFMSLVGSEGIGLVDAIEYAEIDVPSNTYQVVTGGRVRRQEVKRVLVIPNVTIGGNKLSPNQLSEGTFKTLGILFYIITDKSRLLLLEEPEVCVHHGLLASIMEIIKSFSYKKQIVISTHSDFVLDALDPSNVFVVRNYSQKGTVVKHVPSSMSARDYKALKQYLSSTGNLGEYWRNGELEG
jgi:predicted ATPase